ncbi:MAG: hypothetical protein ACXVLX_03240 [Ilumatobacteraceae bacterium]
MSGPDLDDAATGLRRHRADFVMVELTLGNIERSARKLLDLRENLASR